MGISDKGSGIIPPLFTTGTKHCLRNLTCLRPKIFVIRFLPLSATPRSAGERIRPKSVPQRSLIILIGRVFGHSGEDHVLDTIGRVPLHFGHLDRFHSDRWSAPREHSHKCLRGREETTRYDEL